MLIRAEIPFARPGERIGLLGGSFDPPHAGHVLISQHALARFRLDRVWWLLSPGNPLKAQGPASLERRMATARALVRDPRILVSDLEARLGTRYSAATLAGLRRLYPAQRFLWLIGSDNFARFHHWDRWPEILRALPLGILARPGSRLAARTAPAAARFRAARLPEAEAARLITRAPPAWCLVNLPMNAESSSAIRARGGWEQG